VARISPRVYELELDASCIEAPSFVDLAEIGSVMLYPDDAVARDDAKAAAIVQRAREAMRSDLLSDDAVKSLASVDAIPIRALRGEHRRRFEQGAFAGSILFDAVVCAHSNSGSSLGEIMKKYRHRLVGKKASSTHRINEIWTVFRPVAHLWAAHRMLRESFPCGRREIPAFLAVAEQLRVLGEGTKLTRQAPRTLLQPGEAIRLPSALLAKLPKGQLKFSRELFPKK
jgi:hypothetical protein